MDQAAQEYLTSAFGDLINYAADDPLQAIDFLTYKTPEGDSCLHIAAARGDLHATQLLVDAGMEINLRGDLSNTPLHYASMNRHEDIVRFLIGRGALPHLLNELGKAAVMK